ncbi:hypothetical protein KHC33_04160 [Methanospirillum sp. J.3.6.1-F.2.7.3]|uniref:Uncharacterized protein n=1 Tax=Methanospirillum purgamenti TaxID=2834276 RepID=A0A8E7EKH7_9EURY|nr:MULTISPECIES: hypothetical protein [Methanospirillum]MDX8551765.1 hypothetical protein [Methanospirillum hungatei]QVV89716.1 hypothetical protein KHC33_04160 [Methanospirillum sp. J.3.6.1-F.2.7.3]
MRTSHPNAEDDPWTISPEDHERSGYEEGIDTDRPATRARIGSNPAPTADERRLEKERTKEQRATMRVRIPALAWTSDSVFLRSLMFSGIKAKKNQDDNNEEEK